MVVVRGWGKRNGELVFNGKEFQFGRVFTESHRVFCFNSACTEPRAQRPCPSLLPRSILLPPPHSALGPPQGPRHRPSAAEPPVLSRHHDHVRLAGAPELPPGLGGRHQPPDQPGALRFLRLPVHGEAWRGLPGWPEGEGVGAASRGWGGGCGSRSGSPALLPPPQPMCANWENEGCSKYLETCLAQKFWAHRPFRLPPGKASS